MRRPCRLLTALPSFLRSKKKEARKKRGQSGVCFFYDSDTGAWVCGTPMFAPGARLRVDALRRGKRGGCGNFPVFADHRLLRSYSCPSVKRPTGPTGPTRRSFAAACLCGRAISSFISQHSPSQRRRQYPSLFNACFAGSNPCAAALRYQYRARSGYFSTP